MDNTSRNPSHYKLTIHFMILDQRTNNYQLCEKNKYKHTTIALFKQAALLDSTNMPHVLYLKKLHIQTLQKVLSKSPTSSRTKLLQITNVKATLSETIQCKNFFSGGCSSFWRKLSFFFQGITLNTLFYLLLNGSSSLHPKRDRCPN